MKFKIGDEVDENHCIVITHEFFRCEDAFKEFKFFANEMIINGKNKEVSYKTYNAYANFIHRLYEFILGCLARDYGNTEITDERGNKRTKIIDGDINLYVQRKLNNRREAIINRTAPEWENDISYYPETVPPDFAKDFRKYRNKISGHVTHERVSKLNLTDFYRKYHKFLFMLYQDSIYWWGNKNFCIPNLKDITDFSVLIEKERF